MNIPKQNTNTSFLAACLFLASIFINSTVANAQSIADYSVLPAGVLTSADVTTEVMIVLDNSASMRNSVGSNFDLVGADHVNSRAYVAREVLRDVLLTLGDNVSVGLMEFDIGWTRESSDRSTWAISTCGDLSPSPIPGDPTHVPTPLFPDCPDPAGYTLDKFNRIPANPATINTTYYNAFRPDDTGVGRLRVGIAPLSNEHLERLNNALGPSPQLPELRCTRERNANNLVQSQNNNNGVRECLPGAPFVDDFTDTNPNRNFPAGTPGVGTSAAPFDLATERLRIRAQSYRGGSLANNTNRNSLRYAFNRTLLPDTNNDNIPDLYADPTGPSLTTFGTATYGAILSAHNYMRGITSPRERFLLQNGDVQPGDPNFTPAASSISLSASSTTGAAAQCQVRSVILVITDGEPFTLLDGSNINDAPKELCNNPVEALTDDPTDGTGYNCIDTPGNDNDARQLAHTRNTISPLLAAMRLGFRVNPDGTLDANNTFGSRNSIETFVFGFAGIDNDGITIMTEMAAAGSKIVQADGSLVDRPPFLSATPEQLRDDLINAFADIAPPIASGGGVAVIASSTDSAGAIVQASYSPTTTETDTSVSPAITEQINWTGELQSFFIDEFGFLREDANGNAILEDFATDPAFELVFMTPADPVNDPPASTQAFRLNVANIGDPNQTLQITRGPAVDPSDIQAVWRASEILTQQALDDTSAGVGTVQRPYNVAASNNGGFRYIFTWEQADPLSQNFHQGTQTDFLPGFVDASNFGLFSSEPDPAIGIVQAQETIRFIRGEEGIGAGSGLRSRTLFGTPHLLGDIVNSSAAVVDTPAEDFVSSFGDASYQAFQDAYSDRRRMVYVGSNGGLLHAFNGGFFDGANQRFWTTASQNGCTTNCDDVAHELGAEIWAYAPMNLFPHLQFLTRQDYLSNVHVAFVDSPVQTFDVQAFTPDATHIQGWGTILVAQMRLGGGDFNVDPDNDPNTNNAFTTRSAYIVLDVTDPRQPPTVIAEITDPNLGFSTVIPTIQRDDDDWYLVFGTGPNDILNFNSVDTVDSLGNATTRQPQLYRYLLNESAIGNRLNTEAVATTESSFLGNPVSHDWDSDTIDDAIYFGVIGGTVSAPSGNSVRRYVGDPASAVQGQMRTLIDTEAAAPTAAPLLLTDDGNDWVSFGTGRFFVDQDLENATDNSLFAVLETRGTYPETLTDLVDVSNINVSVMDGSLSGGPVGIAEANALRTAIISAGGWRNNFDSESPSDRVNLSPQNVGDQLFSVRFSPGIPNNNECVPTFGNSFLDVVDIATGVPSFVEGFEGTLGNDGNFLSGSTSFGNGFIGAFSIIRTLDQNTGEENITIQGGDQGGGLPQVTVNLVPGSNGRTSWRELEIR